MRTRMPLGKELYAFKLTGVLHTHMDAFRVTLEKRLPRPRKREQRILLTAFPGIASVSLILADVLRDSLHMKEYGWFATPVRPTEIPVEDDVFVPPRIRLSIARTRKATLYLVEGDYQPEGMHAWQLAGEIVRFASRLDARIITIGGIGMQSMPEEPRVYGVRTRNAEALQRQFERQGVSFTLGRQIGMLKVYGMTGIVPVAAEEAGIAAVSLLVETIASAESIGFTAARAISIILGKAFGFTPYLEALEKDIAALREMLAQQHEPERGDMHGTAYIG